MIGLGSGSSYKICLFGLKAISGMLFLLSVIQISNCCSLRFSFVNVGATGAARSPTSDSTGSAMAIQSGLVNTGKAPVLAACLSETFSVYSAKKFPGVVESTHLSKCFATQGIKIPIRKDGPSGKGNKDKEDYDEED
jgi:hypothetical protein